MATFLAAVLAFPTVVFTVLVVFFVLYTLMTLIGALDIHWLDGALGIDHAPDSVLEGALNFLGVAGVPLTIFGGVSTVFSWIASIALTKVLPDSLLLNIGVLLASAILGLIAGGLTVRPFRGVFKTPEGKSRKHVLGKICTVRSLRVNEHSGTAEVDGSGYIAEIRCFRENELTLGSKAIVYDYDHHKGIYHVGPIDPSIATTDYTPRQTDIA